MAFTWNISRPNLEILIEAGWHDVLYDPPCCLSPLLLLPCHRFAFFLALMRESPCSFVAALFCLCLLCCSVLLVFALLLSFARVRCPLPVFVYSIVYSSPAFLPDVADGRHRTADGSTVFHLDVPLGTRRS